MRHQLYEAIASFLLLATTTTCFPLSEPDNLAPAAPQGGSELVAGAVSSAERLLLDHVVVVAIDGVRWQEIFLGVDPRLASARTRHLTAASSAEELTPNIHRIAQAQGTLWGDDTAKVVVSSPSTVSLPGYSELFSGNTPTCANNDCEQTDEPTLLDDWQAADPYSTLALVSSWSRIPRAAARDTARLVISAGRGPMQSLSRHSTDAELTTRIAAGMHANPSPGTEDYRSDAYTSQVALRTLESIRPEFLFVGLGDTDEHAHHGDYDAYLSALQRADAMVGKIDGWLSAQRQIGRRTLLVVTTDHGRSATFRNHGHSPEAARIWMLWSGTGIRGRGAEAPPDPRLADVAPTIRSLLGLAAAPRRSGAGHELQSLIGPLPSSIASAEDSALRLARRPTLNR